MDNVNMKTILLGGVSVYCATTMALLYGTTLSFNNIKIDRLEKTIYVLGAPVIVPSVLLGVVICSPLLSMKYYFIGR